MNNLLTNLTNFQKALVMVILGLVVYLVSAGVTYSVVSALNKNGGALSSSIPTPSSVVGENPNEPKTETCPLNGSLHTKEAREAWEKRRPLAVMIENHIEARPQSGLSSADVVYEAVAEGGITRFMALYYCNLGDIEVGPVRSARTYFLDWLSEYDGLYAHVGGANSPGPANALGQIIDYGIKDLNQFSIGFPTFWRDYQRLGHPVATEHTMYSTTQKLWAVGAQRKWTATDSAGIKWDKNFVSWKFKDDQAGGSGATSIKVPFWESQGNYLVNWSYDGKCNCYKRKNAGADHLDLDNNQILSPKVVIVQFERETHANDGYEGNVHLLYGTKGSGKALIFEDGKVTSVTWNKANRLSRTHYLDGLGVEVNLNKGQIWIETVPEGSNVTFN